MMRDQVILLCFFIVTKWHVSLGFPTGAGSCDGGKAAVGGEHLDRNQVISGALSEIAIEVSVGGNVYEADSRIPLLPGIDYKMSISTTDPVGFFRGALIRLEALEGQDMTGALEPGENLKVSELCILPKIIGITHSDNNNKTSAEGTFRSESPGQIAMDITVVVANTEEISLYGYNRFTIEVTDITVGNDTKPPGTGTPLPSTFTSSPSPSNVASPVPSRVESPPPSQFTSSPSPSNNASAATDSPSTSLPSNATFSPSPSSIVTPAPSTPAPIPSTPAPILTNSPISTTAPVPPSPIPGIDTFPPSRRAPVASSQRVPTTAEVPPPLGRRLAAKREGGTAYRQDSDHLDAHLRTMNHV